MTVMASVTSSRSGEAAVPSRTGRILLVVVAALALVGAVVAVVAISTARPLPVSAEVGSPVTAGSVTVTRVSTTFVPTTQGPPTKEKMAGTVGTQQLQVWVELVGEDENGLAYAPDRFRLVLDGEAPRAPDGSTLGEGILPKAAAVTGQVWFDDVATFEDGWLDYSAPDGTIVRFALADVAEPLPEKPLPEPGPSHGGHG